MLKAALGALIVVGAFGGALYAGGNVMGAWEPYEPAQPTGSPAVDPKQLPPAEQRSRPRKAKAARDARWIRRADALCSAAHRETAEMRQPRTAEEMRAFLTRGMTMNRRWNARFLRLGAPRGEGKRFGRLRGLFREDEALMSDLAAAVRQQDGASAMLLGERLMGVARRESRLMVSLGAGECALAANAI